MKKSKRMMRKFLLTLSSALLLVSLTVGATVAYLTDTEDVVNTFTVGNVQIDLDEAKVKYDEAKNEYVPVGTTREDVEQEYHLLPGTKIAKDPTVRVLEKSEKCYVRSMISVSYYSEADAVLDAANWMSWITWDTNWNITGLEPETVKTTVGEGENAKTLFTRTYEVRYIGGTNGIVDAKTEQKNLPIFTQIKIPGTLTNEQIETLQGLSITVVANAIQANGFADADEAWLAFKGQQTNP